MNRLITIGFSTTIKQSIFTKIITCAESLFSNKKIKYSHVYIQFYFKNIERHVIFQTNKHGAHFIERGVFAHHNHIYKEYHFEISDAAYTKCLQTCVDKCATPYGFLQIIGMGLSRIVNKWFNLKIKNPFGDGGNTGVCSELTAEVLEAAGFEEFKSYDWEYYGPAELDHVLSKLLETTLKE